MSNGTSTTELQAILNTIKEMESGNYSAPPNAGGASGAYQFIQSTWTNEAKAAGYPTYANSPAYEAPPQVQDAVAGNYVQSILNANGGDVGAVPLTWYYPAAIGNPALLNAVPDPGAGNTLTPAQYQQNWLAKYVQAGGTGSSAALTSASSTTPASAGGGQAGAPYSPSGIPGVPSTPPTFPDFTAVPYNELGRIVSWGTEFGAWAFFALIIFLIGIVFVFIGLALIGIVLLGPVAKPAGEVVAGRTLVGRAVKRSQRAVTSGARTRGTEHRMAARREHGSQLRQAEREHASGVRIMEREQSASTRQAEREHASGVRIMEREQSASTRRYGSGAGGVEEPF